METIRSCDREFIIYWIGSLVSSTFAPWFALTFILSFFSNAYVIAMHTGYSVACQAGRHLLAKCIMRSAFLSESSVGSRPYAYEVWILFFLCHFLYMLLGRLPPSGNFCHCYLAIEAVQQRSEPRYPSFPLMQSICRRTFGNLLVLHGVSSHFTTFRNCQFTSTSALALVPKLRRFVRDCVAECPLHVKLP